MRCQFKDLCIDTNAPDAAAAFWSAALRLTPERNDDGSYVLRDSDPQHTIWINVVPEAKTVKNRLHLDVHVGSVAELQALGATVLDDSFHWTVMQDPEGAEFCAFVRESDELPDNRVYELVVDCHDSEAVARWWGEVWGVPARREEEEPPVWYLDTDDGMAPYPVIFGPVPEPKRVKNRVHWDVIGSTDELLVAGATLLRSHDDEISWDVLADPEGNEFCVFAAI